MIIRLCESADGAAIVLTADGWGIEVHPDRWLSGNPLAPITSEDIRNALNDSGSGQAVVEALVVPGGGGPYTIADEYGGEHVPDDDEAPQVVTYTWDREEVGQPIGWREAWWFDLNLATPLIVEPNLVLFKTGSRRQIWQTDRGRYVGRTDTFDGPGARVWPGTWSEMRREDVIEFAYLADDNEFVSQALSRPAGIDEFAAALNEFFSALPPEPRHHIQTS